MATIAAVHGHRRCDVLGLFVSHRKVNAVENGQKREEVREESSSKRMLTACVQVL